jgi:4,5-DOPA dioxygenase extradiol
LRWDKPNLAYDWTERFDDAVAQQLARDPADILEVIEHRDYSLAVPTPDHFIPLLYVAGLATADAANVQPLVHGYSMGSISMTCYGIDADTPLRGDADCAAGLPSHVPPEQTNM